MARGLATTAGPPLWVWPISLSLCAVAVLAAYRVPPPEEGIYRHMHQQLRELARTRTADQPCAVLLGNSILSQATHEDAEMSRLLAQRLGQGRRAHVLGLYAAGIRFDFFERVWDDILRARPDLVVIHSNLFVGREEQFSPVPRTRTLLAHLLTGRAFDAPAPPPNVRHPPGARCASFPPPERIAAHAEVVSQRFDDFDGLPASLTQQLGALRAQGGRVAFITLPRSPSLRALTRRARDTWTASFERQAAALGVPSWVQPADIPDAEYCDSAHVGPLGRARPAALILDRMAALLSVRTP